MRRFMAAGAVAVLAVTALVQPAIAAPTRPAWDKTPAVRDKTPAGWDDGTPAGAVAAYRNVFPQMSEAAARIAFTQQAARKAVVLAADPATLLGSWFDPPAGVLHVAVTAASPAVEAAASRAGVRLEVDRSMPAAKAVGRSPRQLDACSSRLTCDTSLRSGSILRHYGLPICSAGFTARDSANQRYLYTAGHCDIGPGRWSTGRQTIGSVSASKRSGPVDVAAIRVENTVFGGNAGGEIYSEDDPGRTVAVDGVATSMAELLQGDVVCLAANFSDINGPNLCGVIGAVSDPDELGMVRVDGVDACTGDSGGGWYQLTSTTHRVAYGIHHDSDDGCHGDSGGSHSWFSPLPLVDAAFGLTTEG